jgi:hypothetical protein
MSIEHLRGYLDSERLCQNPVFIIGSPRSGTTALANALGQHPDFWVSKESYVLHQLYGQGRAALVWEQNWARATPSWLRQEGVERAEFLGFLGVGINALFTSRSHGRRWIDQTPLYTLMVDDLADMIPGAVFLHILRDGRSVVRSMMNFENLFDEVQQASMTNEIPAWSRDFRLACATWAKWVDAASAFAAVHPDRCLTVRNESLVGDPAAGFDAIHAFLGVPADPSPARTFRHRRVNSSFRGDATRPQDDDWSDWDAHLRGVFAEAAGATLVRAKYTSVEELARWAKSDCAD